MAFDKFKGVYYLDDNDISDLKYYVEKRVKECNDHLKRAYYLDTVNYWEQEKHIAEELKITLIAMEEE